MSGEPMLLVLLLGLLLLCDSVAPCPLVDVTVCDNPYCIGFRTGATFSEMIHSRLAASKQLPGWRAFYATEHGKAVVQALAETNCAMYERQHSELAGIADGSGASYEDILLINLRSELGPYLRNSSKSSGALVPDCIDYLAGGSDGAAIAHNEDNDEVLIGHCYFVKARVDAAPARDPEAPQRTFTAFTYAGELPTGAFAVSDSGFGFSVNALFPRDIRVRGIARSFVLRHVLDNATSASAALELVSAAAPHLSAGFNFNLIEANHAAAAPAAPPRVWTVEAGGGAAASVYSPPASTSYFHANEYRRLSLRQFKDPSSAHRLRTYEDGYANASAAIGVGVRLLGDTSDKDYPVFRGSGGTGPAHNVATLATALFFGGNASLSVLRGNPRLGQVARRLSFARL